MAETQATAKELLRALHLRADYLDEIVGHLRGPLDESRTSLRSALGLVGEFPQVLRDVAQAEWDRNPDPTSRVGILLQLLRRFNLVADLIERHLAHGTRKELTESVSYAVATELERLGVGHYQAVVAHAEANNFETKSGDFERYIFGTLRATVGAPPRPPATYGLFTVPRVEGSGVYWRPLLLGHEVAHIAVRHHGSLATFDLAGKFDFVAAQTMTNPSADAPGPNAAMGLYRIAESWAVELLCDAHALNRFGPAFIASLAEFFSTIGAMEVLEPPSHPPGRLRVRLLLERLGAITDARMADVLTPWDDHVPPATGFAQPWAQHLADLFMNHRDELWTAIAQFSPRPYWDETRVPVITALADRLADGIPGQEIFGPTAGEYVATTDADLVNAAWLSRSEAAVTPIDDLCAKAIDTMTFLQRWTKSGGEPPLGLHQRVVDQQIVQRTPEAEPVQPVTPAEVATGAALAADEIERRLVNSDGQLVITPMLQRPKGTGYDLRLGTGFIVFRRTGISAFDPLDLDSNPRSIQTHIDLSWTDQFVLHPQEVVLAATLEYLVLPNDLTAQVITRSSYGRLGLLSATAVQVHPNFHGCLTLELVNLSTIPLVLTPGERIAQLVLWRCDPVEDAEEKYSYSTGPQFSKVRDDAEADTLRALRKRV